MSFVIKSTCEKITLKNYILSQNDECGWKKIDPWYDLNNFFSMFLSICFEVNFITVPIQNLSIWDFNFPYFIGNVRFRQTDVSLINVELYFYFKNFISTFSV